MTFLIPNQQYSLKARWKYCQITSFQQLNQCNCNLLDETTIVAPQLAIMPLLPLIQDFGTVCQFTAWSKPWAISTSTNDASACGSMTAAPSDCIFFLAPDINILTCTYLLTTGKETNQQELWQIWSWTNKNSCNVVVQHFCDDEIPRLVFIKSRNKLRSQLFDCIVSVQRQEIAYWLLVLTRHKYHT